MWCSGTGGQVTNRPGEAGECRREVGVGAQQVGAQPVDEQEHDPPGAGERRGEVERIGRQVAAGDRDAECVAAPGQHVGEGWRRRRAAPPGRAAAVSRAGARTCRPVAMSRYGDCSARASSRARTAAGIGPGGGLEQVGDDGDTAPWAGPQTAPSTSASRSCGVKRRRAGLDRAGRRVAVLEQGQGLDRVPGDGTAQDGARAVGGRELT